MFAMHGFSLITFLALVGGMIVHSLKHFRQAKVAGVSLTFKAYWIDNWDTSATSFISAAVLWAGIPEIAQMFPDAAASVGVDGKVGIIGSFACGIIGNSLADLLGKRAKAISEKS